MSTPSSKDLKNFEYIDFRFTDLHGTWHHISFPQCAVNEGLLSEGIAFDGSSIEGWKSIHESDMILKPDLSTLVDDPFTDVATGIVFCDVIDPETNTPYTRDPRSIAKKAEAYLASTGIGDLAYFGPEAEFFIFDDIQYTITPEACSYQLYGDELPSSSGSAANHGYRPKQKGGYMPCPPIDSCQNIRGEMLTTMAAMGLVPEKHHHEVATAQHELGIQCNTLTTIADGMQLYKYAVHNVAYRHGKTATFMPKPLYGDNGSGMHVHQSLWKEGSPLFAGDAYAGLSKTALYYIGGILKHAKALNAFTNPTTNSYKRLIPGFEAPVICAYSARNRSASIRIPTSFSPKAKRIEVRFPDPTACSYLAFAAMLLAGLDGIKHKIEPGDAADQNLFEDTDYARQFPTVSHSLREALNALDRDTEFLRQGDVFTAEFLEAYKELKWKEVYDFEHHPHPLEFQLYYNR